MNVYVTPQPAPQQQGDPDSGGVIDTVIDDMVARREFGRAKYGTVLKPNDGRNNQIDIYQELLDLVVYTKKGILEDFVEPTELW